MSTPPPNNVEFIGCVRKAAEALGRTTIPETNVAIFPTTGSFTARLIQGIYASQIMVLRDATAQSASGAVTKVLRDIATDDVIVCRREHLDKGRYRFTWIDPGTGEAKMYKGNKVSCEYSV